LQQQAAIRERLHEIQQRILTPANDGGDVVTRRDDQSAPTPDAPDQHR